MGIPDLNLFMMCDSLDTSACREMPSNFYVRTCRKDELEIWKAMPFDDPDTAAEYADFMTSYFDGVYADKGDLFFEKCLFVCNDDDIPIATCFIWKAYGKVNTIHWYKVLKPYEGLGIGRALLTLVMKDLQKEDYPVYLHTQPSSYRAIKLYSDFGFSLLSDPVIGGRRNDLDPCLPILEEHMPREEYRKLRTCEAPQRFLEAVSSSGIHEF